MSAPTAVTFPSRAYTIAAHLYAPVAGSPDRHGAAIVIAHPWTSIKEQSPANYARVLTRAGFVALTYDAAFQGESTGEPRALEDPGQRSEDIKNAVTYLVGLSRQTNAEVKVDADRIGVLGICASGGYAAFAAQTDVRIGAVATVAAVCAGTMARRGYERDSTTAATLRAQLDNAARDRNSDVGLASVPVVHLLPESWDPVGDKGSLPEAFADLASYYRTPRARHPRAPNTAAARSWDLLANFDAFAYNELISPRPLLMITGSAAATKWYSEDGIAKAKEPKELVVLDGHTHASLYDHVDEAGAKLVQFFAKYLVEKSGGD